MRPLLVLLLAAAPLAAQVPTGPAKPRLELSDTTRRIPEPRTERPRPQATAKDSNVVAVKTRFRSAFVRRQTMLGLALYAPSFASTVTTKPVPWTAAYLVMAGGSFFAAMELSHDLQITDGMETLAAVAPIQGAAIGGALQYGLTGNGKLAPGIFFGSVLGTAGALTLGSRLTPGAASAAIIGANAAAAFAAGTMYAFDEKYTGDRTRAVVAAGAALAGMQLGAMYATYSPYNITAGDVHTMLVSTLVGTAAAGAFVSNGHPGHKTTTLALEGGALAGLIAGDRLLVRRYDHTRGEATLVGLGALAGGLMGGGVSVIVGSSARFNAATAGLGAIGATGGMWMVERWLGAHPDAGRRLADRITIAPQGLALAAARVPGTYSLARVTF